MFLSTGDSIGAGETRELFVPFVLSIGDKAVRAEWVEADQDAGYQSLIAPTVLPETIERRGGEPFTPALHLLPDADLHVFARCGHWTQIERAAEFTALVAGFLAGGAR